MADHSGQQFGNYRLLRLLGRGGFAEVYLGEHVYLHTKAAIKVLHLLLADDDAERFLAEAHTMADLQHKHIVRVFDFAVQNDVPFLVMDYAPNGTLRSRHPRGTPLPPTVILPYVKQVAAALQYMHTHNWVHCDVKPQNMLVGPSDQIWLSDFGLTVIARNTGSLASQDMMRGSPAYMAPEQFGPKPRLASDQYALGIAVYEWLCGYPPFPGPTLTQFYIQHMNTPPPSMRGQVPEISPAVEKVVQRALAKDRHQRFARVQDFADALEEACRSEPYLLPPSAFDLFPSVPVESFSTRLPAASEEPAVTVLPPKVSPPVTRPAVPLPETSSQLGQVAPAPASAKEVVPVIANAPAQAQLFAPPPNVVPVPGIAASPQLPVGRKRSISRRTVVAWLITSGLIAVGGTGALVWNRLNSGPSSAQTHTTKHTSTPTPGPLGSTYTEYSGHEHSNSPGYLTAAAWSPANVGNRITSADTNGHVQVWDAFYGGNVVSYKGHTDEVKTVAWSPDGKYIASGGKDATVRVWDPVTQMDILVSPFKGHTQTVRSVSWSPDGRYIASGSEDQTVRVWDSISGTSRVLPWNYPNAILTIAWSADGNYIAFGGFNTHSYSPVFVWDFFHNTMTTTYTQHKNDVRSIAWSPDSKYVASGSSDHTVQVWEATTGRPRFTYSGHHGAVWSVAWSPDGHHIASGGKDGTVQICNATSGDYIFAYKEATNEVWAVAWSPDSEYIVSGSNDQVVRVWQAK